MPMGIKIAETTIAIASPQRSHPPVQKFRAMANVEFSVPRNYLGEAEGWVVGDQSDAVRGL